MDTPPGTVALSDVQPERQLSNNLQPDAWWASSRIVRHDEVLPLTQDVGFLLDYES